MSYTQEFDDFTKISERARKLFSLIGRKAIEEAIKGLSLVECSAMTAALHSHTDFEIWGAYHRAHKNDPDYHFKRESCPSPESTPSFTPLTDHGTGSTAIPTSLPPNS